MEETKIISKINDKSISLILWNLEVEIFKENSWTFKNLEDHLISHNCILISQCEKAIAYLLYLEGLDSNELLRIGVLPSFRNKGYGFKLIQTLIRQEKSIYLEVRNDNHLAIPLYEKIGFQRIGMRKKYYKDGMDGLIYFLR
jgi:ribosomal-protein-alanine N-acetyltransferase